MSKPRALVRGENTKSTEQSWDRRKPQPQAEFPFELFDAAPPACSIMACVRAVFDYWTLKMGKKQPVLDEKRQRLIRARLENGYSLESLKLAIDGCAADPFSQGQNNRHKKYNDIALICRDAIHVDRFIDMAKSQPQEPSPSRALTDEELEHLYEDFPVRSNG